MKDFFARVLVAEWREVRPVAPVVLGFVLAVMVALAVFHGLGWYLGLFLLGGVLGAVVLDTDKALAPALGTAPDFFHTFRIYPLIFLLAVFVITANATVLGKGMVLAMMVHGLLSFVDRKEQAIAAGLLGVTVILLLL